MITFDPDAGRTGVARPGEAPIDGQLVCRYPCPRCSNPARAPVHLGDAALAQEIVAEHVPVWCENQRGRLVATGTAQVTLHPT